MLLLAGEELVVAHTVATRRVSFGKVARLVGGPVKLAGSRRLGKLGLMAGRVNPFMDCLEGLPHLVSTEVLRRPFLTTNDGTFTGFVRFAPSLLLKLDRVALEDIDEAP
jgi:prolyl-tRNA editing enzyme YbaK/EbsC (Cys-tRNA(Pro) deacylase)